MVSDPVCSVASLISALSLFSVSLSALDLFSFAVVFGTSGLSKTVSSTGVAVASSERVGGAEGSDGRSGGIEARSSEEASGCGGDGLL